MPSQKMFHIVTLQIRCNFLTPQVAIDSIMAKILKMFSQIGEGIIDLATE